MATHQNITNSIFNFNQDAFSDQLLKESFKSFLNQPLAYRTQFLQEKYALAFDGYSYLGQENSLNQYSHDLLHSFVLSEFSSINSFPKEFHEFLNSEFKTLNETIKKWEIQLLKDNDLNELAEVYQENFGYMISCNFYPKVNIETTSSERLSAHKDVSLFSIFPFGLTEGLVYKTNEIHKIGEKKNSFGFKGFGLEYFTNRKLKGLNHFVELPEHHLTERFSAAFFSIPKPNTTFTLYGKTFQSETFYQDYLNLF